MGKIGTGHPAMKIIYNKQEEAVALLGRKFSTGSYSVHQWTDKLESFYLNRETGRTILRTIMH